MFMLKNINAYMVGKYKYASLGDFLGLIQGLDSGHKEEANLSIPSLCYEPLFSITHSNIVQKIKTISGFKTAAVTSIQKEVYQGISYLAIST